MRWDLNGGENWCVGPKSVSNEGCEQSHISKEAKVIKPGFQVGGLLEVVKN